MQCLTQVKKGSIVALVTLMACLFVASSLNFNSNILWVINTVDTRHKSSNQACRVGLLGTYRNLLRILALGDMHDNARKVIAFINSELNEVIKCEIATNTIQKGNH